MNLVSFESSVIIYQLTSGAADFQLFTNLLVEYLSYFNIICDPTVHPSRSIRPELMSFAFSSSNQISTTHWRMAD